MKNLLKLTLLVNMVMAAQENDVNASNADIEEVVVKGQRSLYRPSKCIKNSCTCIRCTAKCIYCY